MDREYNVQALAWQKTEDYTEGLRLWKQRYGENLTYRTLCRGVNPFNQEKMLAGIMEGVTAPDELPEAEKPDPAKEELKSEVSDLVYDVDDLQDRVYQLEDRIDELTGAKLPPEPKPQKTDHEPEEIRKMRETTYGLMDERIALKQRLRELPDPARREDRTKAALRILDITDELDILFAKLDYFREHGRVPEQVVIEGDVIQYPKEYLNLRTYVSKVLKKINGETNPKLVKEYELHLAKYRKRMAEIETEL